MEAGDFIGEVGEELLFDVCPLDHDLRLIDKLCLVDVPWMDDECPLLDVLRLIDERPMMFIDEPPIINDFPLVNEFPLINDLWFVHARKFFSVNGSPFFDELLFRNEPF